MADKMMRQAVRSPDGTAKAAKGDKEGRTEIIATGNLQKTSQEINLNYKGKTAGDSKPYTVKRGSFELSYGSSRIVYPTPTSSGWSEISTNHYGMITDPVRFAPSQATTTPGEHACMLFSYNLLDALKDKGLVPTYWSVEDAKNNIEKFEIFIDARGEGSGIPGCTLNFWRYTSNRFDITERSNKTKEYSAISVLSSVYNDRVSPLIDDDGFIHFMARTTQPANASGKSELFVRYVEIRVDFKSEYLLTDTAKAYDSENKALRVIN